MAGEFIASTSKYEDRMQMLKAFDETNAGVKGLTDSGLLKLPEIFVRPPHELEQESHHESTHIQVPVIDLSGVWNPVGRRRIVEQMRIASETWGFFQVVSHGIPLMVLDEMVDGVRRFNDQDIEEKRKYYSRDHARKVKFNSSYDLFTSRTASWRDTLNLSFSGPEPTDPEDLPPPCRESAMEYSNHMETLGNILLGLLSEALGLKTDHLKNMDCSKGHRIYCHYYPPCPEPKLAIGLDKHSDPGFITILMQTQDITALQVMHQAQWVDIQPIPGGLVVNIGDLLQMVSNGKFKSNKHRAKATRIGPRITVACVFSGDVNGSKIYSPIEELITEHNPPKYKGVSLREYVAKFISNPLDQYSGLDYYKLR